jgi:hypothetical protein
MPESTGPWIESDGARARVKELLAQSGVPLELEVARICQRFVATTKGRDARISAQRLVYGEATADEAYREIDQTVSFYDEFPLTEKLGIALHIQVLIECKHRKNMEAFAFPYQTENRLQAVMPITSSLAGSRLVRRVASLTPGSIARLPLCGIALLEIDGGKTPNKVLDENLIYKSAASLYDFVKSQIRTAVYSHDPTVRIMDLDAKFREYLQENSYAWWSVARQWIDNQADEVAEEFNGRYFTGGQLYHGIDVYVPVICVESPIYQVDLDQVPAASGFKQFGLSLTGVRIPGWPGSNRENIVAAAAEGLVVLASSTALYELLESVHEFFNEIVATLASSDERLKKRSALEAAFIRDAIHTYSAFDNYLGRYRSDLDLGAP